MARIQKVPTAEFNPFYGCAIMAMAALIFAGIIGWSAYSLLTQDKAIEAITVDAPAVLPKAELPAAAQTALATRLADFGKAAQAGQPAELTLSVAEINAAIALAPDSGYGTYRDLLQVTGTDPGKHALQARISLPMNRLKFWEGRKRYLIGEAAFYIYVHEEGIDAKVVDVRVPGKEVPDGFVAGMEIWPWVAPYRKVEPLGNVLKAVRSVKITPQGLTLSTVAPAAKP